MHVSGHGGLLSSTERAGPGGGETERGRARADMRGARPASSGGLEAADMEVDGDAGRMLSLLYTITSAGANDAPMLVHGPGGRARGKEAACPVRRAAGHETWC